jgi:hypothetical protein
MTSDTKMSSPEKETSLGTKETGLTRIIILTQIKGKISSNLGEAETSIQTPT